MQKVSFILGNFFVILCCDFLEEGGGEMTMAYPTGWGGIRHRAIAKYDVLLAEGGNAVAEGGNFALGISKLLALACHYCLGSLAHESLVAELLLD